MAPRISVPLGAVDRDDDVREAKAESILGVWDIRRVQEREAKQRRRQEPLERPRRDSRRRRLSAWAFGPRQHHPRPSEDAAFDGNGSDTLLGIRRAQELERAQLPVDRTDTSSAEHWETRTVLPGTEQALMARDVCLAKTN
jgi:3'-phosphoadenosine 5'-phosphosulfate sulfotransferase (PAPS reductase)/FAD synthetase